MITNPPSTIGQDDLAASGFVYSLLARLWLREVDAELVESLEATDFCAAFVAAGGVAPAMEQLDDLASEYCRLFVGPKEHLPPYQSVWEKGELQSEVTSSASQFAELLGYRLPPKCPHTLSDHLGVQLDMMGKALQLNRVLSPQDHDLASEVAAEFYSRHLTWPNRLLDAAAERATSEFYRRTITMTSEFLACEREIWCR